MSKIKTKEIIICVITVAVLMLTIVTDVFATGSIDELLNDVNNTTFNTIPEENTTANTTTNNTVNNAINNTVNNTTNNAVNNATSNNTTMPNTGVDYSVVFIIAVCGISAIYAYKKIKDYNNF